MTDTYSTNPLVDRLKQTQPAVHKIASAERSAPTMWESGDLPPMTASGAPAEVLLQLPPGTRHLGASLPTRAELMAFVDQYAGSPAGLVIRSPGYDRYAASVQNWGSGLHSDADPVPATTVEDQDALMTAMFGDAADRMPAPVEDRVAAARKRDLAAAQERIAVSDRDFAKFQASDLAKP
jgi:hypothetical protein